MECVGVSIGNTTNNQQVNKSTKINSFEIVWSKILEAIRAKNLDVSI
jgi:hypothetical protein